MEPREEAQALSALTIRLRQKYPDVSDLTVRAVVAEAHHEFDGRPIRDFIPVLVERGAVDRLRELTARVDVLA